MINQKFQNQYYWGCLINVFFGCWCLLNVNQFLFVLQSSQCFRHVVFLQCLVCCFLNFAAIFPLVIHVLFLPFSMVFTRCSIIFHAFSSIFPWVFTPHSVASPPKTAAQGHPSHRPTRHPPRRPRSSRIAGTCDVCVFKL